MIAVAAHVKQSRVVHPPAGVPRVLWAKSLEAAIWSLAAVKAVMGHIIEAFQQGDRDQSGRSEESECAATHHGDSQEERSLDRDIADHPVSNADWPAPGTPPPLRFKRPCFANLTDDGAREKGVEPLAALRARWVLDGRRSAMVSVHVGDAEVHVKNASEKRD